MPAHHPTLPESYKWAHNTPKGSHTAENSKNYKKWSKKRILIELNLLIRGAGHARTPPCTAWSLFLLKSGVSVPLLGGKCDELATSMVVLITLSQTRHPSKRVRDHHG